MTRVLCLDPSGNFNEGEGTTGWALYVDGNLQDFGAIASNNYPSQEKYWQMHAQAIVDLAVDKVICESYKLFAHKAKQQSGSAMETPQLIGYLRMFCWARGVQVVFQDPLDKVRVDDKQLLTLGVLTKKGNKHYCMGRSTVLHERDAIRHGVFYHRYGKGKNHELPPLQRTDGR